MVIVALFREIKLYCVVVNIGNMMRNYQPGKEVNIPFSHIVLPHIVQT